MKYSRKTIAGGLVIILALFAGSLCLHAGMAFAAQAVTDVEMDMGNFDQTPAQTSHESVQMITGIPCTVNCVTVAPRAVAPKKFNLDVSGNVLGTISEEGSYTLAFVSTPTVFTGIHPPAPDILSSVFKKE